MFDSYNCQTRVCLHFWQFTPIGKQSHVFLISRFVYNLCGLKYLNWTYSRLFLFYILLKTFVLYFLYVNENAFSVKIVHSAVFHFEKNVFIKTFVINFFCVNLSLFKSFFNLYILKLFFLNIQFYTVALKKYLCIIICSNIPYCNLYFFFFK